VRRARISGHARAVELDFDDHVMAGAPHRDERARRRQRARRGQEVRDEPVRGPLHVLRQPFGREVQDGDRSR